MCRRSVAVIRTPSMPEVLVDMLADHPGISAPWLTLAVYPHATTEADRAASGTAGDRLATAMRCGDGDRMATEAPETGAAAGLDPIDLHLVGRAGRI